MKKLICLLITVILLVSLIVSCGQQPEPTNPTGTEITAVTEGTETTENTEATGSTEKAVNNYPGQFFPDGAVVESYDTDGYFRVTVQAKYDDCLIAEDPNYQNIRYRLIIGDCDVSEYCPGDVIDVALKDGLSCSAGILTLIEAQITDIKIPELPIIDPNIPVAYKPVIYLYPETETDVSVVLELDGSLTCTYPKYNNGWNVKALPDGTLTDGEGKTYNYLYWEGTENFTPDFSCGFCVKGSDTAEFLEWALEKSGLTRKEANEFIVYWLPLMEQNTYNVISFQGSSYTAGARLDIAPAPDTLVRVFMAWYGTDEYTEIQPQTLNAPERTGFTVVEWGGTEIR